MNHLKLQGCISPFPHPQYICCSFFRLLVEGKFPGDPRYGCGPPHGNSWNDTSSASLSATVAIETYFWKRNSSVKWWGCGIITSCIKHEVYLKFSNKSNHFGFKGPPCPTKKHQKKQIPCDLTPPPTKKTGWTRIPIDPYSAPNILWGLAPNFHPLRVSRRFDTARTCDAAINPVRDTECPPVRLDAGVGNVDRIDLQGFE